MRCLYPSHLGINDPAALTLKGTAAPAGRADPSGRAPQAHKDTPSDKVSSARERSARRQFDKN